MASLTTCVHPLLTSDVLKLLKEKQISTLYQFVKQDPNVLSKITKIAFKSILVIRKHILNRKAALNRNGLDYYNNDIVNKTAIISTNLPSLDAILGGGFYTGNIYEACTRSPDDSTRFLYKFVINFIEKHGNNQKIMFYDTKFTFNPMRLKNICDQQFGEQIGAEMLSNLLICQVENIYQLLNALYNLKEQLEKRTIKKLRVIIIDTVTALFYSSIRIKKHNMLLNCLVNVMRLLSVEYHVCFIVSNLLTVKQSTTGEVEAKVYGGKYWQGVPNIRLRLVPNAKDGNESRFDCCVLRNNMGHVHTECSIDI